MSSVVCLLPRTQSKAPLPTSTKFCSLLDPEAPFPEKSRLLSLKAKRNGSKRCPLQDLLTAVYFGVVTVLTLAAGSTILILGTMAYVDETSLKSLIQLDTTGKLQAFNMMGLLKSAALLLMIAGCTILLIGLLGCCGVLLKSKTLMSTLGFLILIIALAQIFTAATTLTYPDEVKSQLGQTLVAALRKNYDGQANSSNPFSQTVDFTQLMMGCCGVDTALDFVFTPWFRQRHASSPRLPRTCCSARASKASRNYHLANESCPYIQPGSDNPNTATPCLSVVQAFLTNQGIFIFAVTTSVVVVELSVVYKAFKTVRKLGQEKETG